MRDRKDNRSRWLHVRLKPEEYDSLQKNCSQTTCRKMSEYARKILLGKPLTTVYRNQSLDEFMAEMIRLRNELNAIGSNFDQAVKKLHALDRPAGFATWLMACEVERKILFGKVDEIKKRIGQMADQWLANP